jgi:hypothetical protein
MAVNVKEMEKNGSELEKLLSLSEEKSCSQSQIYSQKRKHK